MRNLIIGFVFGILAGFMLYKPYSESSYAQVNACIDQHTMFIDLKDKELVDVAKAEGFKNVKALIRSRCNGWVNGGQKFQ